jgi:hypothetical protein
VLNRSSSTRAYDDGCAGRVIVSSQSPVTPRTEPDVIARSAPKVIFLLVLAAAVAVPVFMRLSPVYATPGQVLVGDRNIEAQVDSNRAGIAEASSYVAAASGTVIRLYLFVDVGNTGTAAVVGLYSDSNGPAMLLAQGTINSPSPGQWNGVDVTAVNVTAGAKYWIAVLGPVGAGILQYRDVGGGSTTPVSASTTLTTLPATWSSAQSFQSGPISVFAGVPATSPPAISNVVVGTVSDSSAVVTWTTDEASSSQLDVGPTTAYGISSQLDPALVTIHTATIFDLMPATTYQVHAVSVDADGLRGTSANFTITTLPPSSPSVSTGEWSPIIKWPYVGVHQSLLPTGQIIGWDAWEASSPTHLWDPSTQSMANFSSGSGLFCDAQVSLADGRLLTIGGHDDGTFLSTGTMRANIFDPWAHTWTRVADMAFPRWYPGALVLPDGRVLAVSGEIVSGTFADTAEVYDPTTNAWTQLPVSTSQVHEEQYPYLFQLPSGKIFVLGPGSNSNGILDVNAKTWTSGVLGANPFAESAAVMYRPGKVLYAGGFSATAPLTSAAVVDMTQPSPAWLATGSMAHARAEYNLVVLADGTVLAVGGTNSTGTQTATTGTMPAEIWDPGTGTWTTVASLQEPRQYHSTALLLPDGRVLATGGGRFNAYQNFFTAQIYSPPYLFKGPRPTVNSAPSGAGYNAAMTIGTPDAASIASVSMVRIGANTHAQGFNQSFIPLSFTAGADTLTVTSPASANIAPPGHYMLFIGNSAGVPSVAKIIQLTNGPVSTPTPATPTPTGAATNTPTPTPSGPTSTPTNTAVPTATGTSTATPAGGTDVQFGITTSGGANDVSDSGFINGSNAAVTTPGTLKSLSVYVGATPTKAHVRLALYTDVGNQPGALLAETGEAVAAIGWNTLAVVGGPAVQAGTYWIVAQTDNAATVYRIATGLPSSTFEGWTAFAYGAFPATMPAGWTNVAGQLFDMYGTVTTAAPPTATSTSVPPTPTSTPVSATATSTPVPATFTSTPVPATATSTPVPATATSTPVPATFTSTPVPATATSTPVPATFTSTPVPATATSTPVPTATSTSTPTPSGGTDVQFGITTSAGANDSSDSGYINGSNAAVTTPGTLKSLSVYVGSTAANAHVRLALYADAGNRPGALVAQSGEAVATSGWNTLPVAAGPAVAAGMYWIVAQTDNAATVYRIATGLPAGTFEGWTVFAYGAFPASMAAGWTNVPGQAFDMYGTLTTGAPLTATSTPLPPTATNTPLPTTATSTPSSGTATATASATPVAATLFGNTSSAGVNDESDFGFINGSSAVLGQAGTLTSLSVYVG